MYFSNEKINQLTGIRRDNTEFKYTESHTNFTFNIRCPKTKIEKSKLKSRNI